MSSIPVITELDAARIRELVARLPAAGRGFASAGSILDLVTSEAEVVPRDRIAPDIVTVNSTVSFRDEVTGATHRVTLVYPLDVSLAERRISVLSPVGQALLGRRAGAATELEMPDGTCREIRVLELHYQPEAAGDPN